MKLKLEFLKSAYNLKHLPEEKLPEVVVCGRSNVGKSSLLNTLAGKKNLAKVSSTPGKTESINYFQCDKSFYLVDLPGYGFAKRDKKTIASWGKMIDTYLRGSGNIAICIHLVDCRHPITQSDIELEAYFQTIGLTSYIVLTKSDKLKQSEKSFAVKEIKANYMANDGKCTVQLFSSKTGEGKDLLIKYILESVAK